MAQHRERQPVGVEHRVALLLPAVGRDRLREVAGLVEEADAEERHAEVGGRLEVVAGEDAEAARVLRQGRGDAELRREVRDRARRIGAERLEPARLGEVLAQARAARARPTRRSRRRPRARRAARGRPRRGTPRDRARELRHSSGSMCSNRRCVGSCHDQRRLPASSSSAVSEPGTTARTVNLRIGFTRSTLGRARVECVNAVSSSRSRRRGRREHSGCRADRKAPRIANPIATARHSALRSERDHPRSPGRPDPGDPGHPRPARWPMAAQGLRRARWCRSARPCSARATTRSARCSCSPSPSGQSCATSACRRWRPAPTGGRRRCSSTSGATGTGTSRGSTTRSPPGGTTPP